VLSSRRRGRSQRRHVAKRPWMREQLLSDS
jgi:hypothetical protein